MWGEFLWKSSQPHGKQTFLSKTPWTASLYCIILFLKGSRILKKVTTIHINMAAQCEAFLNMLHCRCLMLIMLYWLHPNRECWGLNMCLSNTYVALMYPTQSALVTWPAPSDSHYEILLRRFFSKRSFSWRFCFMHYIQYSISITAQQTVPRIVQWTKLKWNLKWLYC